MKGLRIKLKFDRVFKLGYIMVNGISNGRLEGLYYSNAGASCVSILGCVFILSMYLLFKEINRYPYIIIAILSGLDLLNSISFTIPTYENSLSDNICVLQGVLMNFSTFASMIWSTIIAVYLYAIVVKGRMDIFKFTKWYFLFDLLLAGVLTVLPNFYESRNTVIGYCWLYRGGSKEQYIKRFIAFLVPFWAIAFINIAIYVAVLINLKAGIGGEDAQVRKRLAIKLGVYPLFIFLCYLPYSVKGVLEINQEWNRFKYEYGFTLVAGVFRCLIGFVNAMIYGLTGNVRKILKERIRKKKKEMVSCQLLNKAGA